MPTYRDYLDYSEGFFANAKQATKAGTSIAIERSIICSILLSWIAMESFINDMMADFSALDPKTFSLPEWALLTERSLEFADSGDEAGQFYVSERPEYRRLDDKIMFLLARFGRGAKLDKGGTLWQKFEAVKGKRNQITHPRKLAETPLTLSDAEDALEVAKAVITMVSKEVWGKAVKL